MDCQDIKECSKKDQTDCFYSHAFKSCPNDKCWIKISQEQIIEEMEEERRNRRYG